MHTQSPTATPAPPALSKLMLALHGLSLVAAALAAYSLWSSLPAFAEVFASFGADLPHLTRLVIENPQALWNILRTALANHLLWLGLWLVLRERWSSIGLLLSALGAWLLVGLTLVALYLPILRLGEVV